MEEGQPKPVEKSSEANSPAERIEKRSDESLHGSIKPDDRESEVAKIRAEKRVSEKNRENGISSSDTDKHFSGQRLGLYDGQSQLIPENGEAARAYRLIAEKGEASANPLEKPQAAKVPLDQNTDFHKLLGRVEKSDLHEYCNNFSYSEDRIEKVRSEIANHSNNDVAKLLCKALKENDILVFGETHRNEPNVLRELGAKLMPELRNAGATHIAIELDEKYQPLLDQFMKTGKMPEKLGDVEVQDSYRDVLQAARACGIAIKAVDNHQVNFSQGESRDGMMAKNVQKILDADSNNKVIFWVGAMHASHETLGVGKFKTAVDLLDDNHNVASIYEPTFSNEFPNLVSPDLKTDVLVATSETPTLANSKLTDGLLPQLIGGYDYLLMVPRNKRY